MFTPDQLREMSATGKAEAERRKIEADAVNLAHDHEKANYIIKLLMAEAEKAAQAGRNDSGLELNPGRWAHLAIDTLKKHGHDAELAATRGVNVVKILLKW